MQKSQKYVCKWARSPIQYYNSRLLNIRLHKRLKHDAEEKQDFFFQFLQTSDRKIDSKSAFGI